jgi:hypothetical protein
MGVPTSEVGYTLATTGRGDHVVHKGHEVALGWGGGGIINVFVLICACCYSRGGFDSVYEVRPQNWFENFIFGKRKISFYCLELSHSANLQSSDDTDCSLVVILTAVWW